MLRRMRSLGTSTTLLACVLLLSCGADRRSAGGDNVGGAGGGPGDGGQGDGGQGGGGGEGEGEGEPDDEVIVGDIVLPDCTDLDQDGYGEGAGCRGADQDDRDATIFPGAREQCDGKDNDGDGLVDNRDDDFAPEPCALTVGVCQGTNQECRDGVSVPCDPAEYGEHYVNEEGRFDGDCDGRDNDCDEQIDEECECIDGVLQTCPEDACADRSCADGRWGSCIRARNPEPEFCDGVDNDCDGSVDEPEDEFSPPLCGRCPFEMMLVDLNNLDVCVDRWEASREDATRVSPGLNQDGKATSRDAVLPWVAIKRSDALSACRRAGRDRWPDGKDLCTVNQWQEACRYIGRLDLNEDWKYPYGQSYGALKCNGAEADRSQSEPTGSFDECVVAVTRGAFDMSGNVAEWADEQVEGQRAVMGGSYLSDSEGLQCLVPELVSANTEELNIGFRCCKGLPNQ